MKVTTAQIFDQMDRLTELSNIVAAIEDTQPRFSIYPRLALLVEQALLAQEQMIDGIEEGVANVDYIER